jgi:hypothetical protein
MAERSDVWNAMTRMALRLIINDLLDGRGPIVPTEVADTALSAFRGMPHLEQYRRDLESFVRDIVEATRRGPTDSRAHASDGPERQISREAAELDSTAARVRDARQQRPDDRATRRDSWRRRPRHRRRQR